MQDFMNDFGTSFERPSRQQTLSAARVPSISGRLAARVPSISGRLAARVPTDDVISEDVRQQINTVATRVPSISGRLAARVPTDDVISEDVRQQINTVATRSAVTNTENLAVASNNLTTRQPALQQATEIQLKTAATRISPTGTPTRVGPTEEQIAQQKAREQATEILLKTTANRISPTGTPTRVGPTEEQIAQQKAQEQAQIDNVNKTTDFLRTNKIMDKRLYDNISGDWSRFDTPEKRAKINEEFTRGISRLSSMSASNRARTMRDAYYIIDVKDRILTAEEPDELFRGWWVVPDLELHTVALESGVMSPSDIEGATYIEEPKLIGSVPKKVEVADRRIPTTWIIGGSTVTVTLMGVLTYFMLRRK